MAGKVKIKWGKITAENHKFHDILAIGGQIGERDYNRLKEEFGTSHKIGNWEISKLFTGEPEVIIIGIGYFGAVEVPHELEKQAKKSDIELKLLKSPKAVDKYNSLNIEGKKVNALIHSTC